MNRPFAHPFLMKLLHGGTTASPPPPPPRDLVWETVIQDAVEQDLTFLLARWLDNTGASHALPLPIRKTIKQQVACATARNLALARELTRILQAFEGTRVSCIPMRGLALAEQLYGDMTCRPMRDIDLLVRRDSLPAIAQVLHALGFQQIDRRPGFALAYSNTFEFAKDGPISFAVEPHWTIAYPPFADLVNMDEVWKRCERGSVAGLATWRLSPADLALHLCCHLSHRRDTAPLLWWYELDRLLRQTENTLDWAVFVHVAQQTGQAWLLVEVLGTLVHLFQTPIPAHVWSRLTAQIAQQPSQSVTGSASARLARWLAKDSRVDGRESFALFFTITGLRAKFRYAWALLFPSPEFMLRHYALTSWRQLGFCYARRVLTLSWNSVKGVVSFLVPTRRPSLQ